MEQNYVAVTLCICCRHVSFPSVRPSQAGIVSKWLDESSWFLARRLPSTYPIVCYKEIWVSPKKQCTFLWNFTPNLKNFATSRSRCQQNSSLSSSTVELVDDTCVTIDESWLFTASRSAVTLWLHYFDVLWICCTTCFYGWQDFYWHRVTLFVCYV